MIIGGGAVSRASRSREALIKAARMYYVDGRSQSEVAAALCTTPSNVSRMLTSARQLGIVRITVEDSVPRNQALEQELCAAFELGGARVLAAPAGDPEQVERVGVLAAEYLTDHLREGQRIALSWGTSLQAAVAAVDVERVYSAEVVQLVGGLTGSASDVTGEELVRELAGRLGCEYRYLHAPAVFSSAATRNAVRAEPGVQAALAGDRQADIAIVGIGAAGRGSSEVILREMDLSPAESAELGAASPVGDICGYFYDITGRECLGSLHERVLAIDLAELQRIPTVIGVAAGADKARGLLGALNGRYVDVVACDQTLAERVLALARSAPGNSVGDSSTSTRTGGTP
jgi:DNA-binding transcriptional regulator LsrR (DeoR family)